MVSKLLFQDKKLSTLPSMKLIMDSELFQTKNYKKLLLTNLTASYILLTDSCCWYIFSRIDPIGRYVFYHNIKNHKRYLLVCLKPTLKVSFEMWT